MRGPSIGAATGNVPRWFVSRSAGSGRSCARFGVRRHSRAGSLRFGSATPDRRRGLRCLPRWRARTPVMAREPRGKHREQTRLPGRRRVVIRLMTSVPYANVRGRTARTLAIPGARPFVEQTAAEKRVIRDETDGRDGADHPRDWTAWPRDLKTSRLGRRGSCLVGGGRAATLGRARRCSAMRPRFPGVWHAGCRSRSPWWRWRCAPETTRFPCDR